jgi:redox-sensitive bicupin YhaK (pirin superfamily)
MTTRRRIARIENVPPLEPGFAGPGHTAAPVISMAEFAHTDPFIALMDDHLDVGERQVGGAHPHAGFETVTLVLDGTLHDADEGGLIHAGEVQWMTAGSGIIHGENARTLGKVRLLQLWLTLPKANRWTAPGFQDLHADRVPVRREPGVDVRVYSGASGGVQAPTRNQVPVTIVEMTMKPGASIEQDLPATYNRFVFVLDGSVRVGEGATPIERNQVGWLDRPPHGDGVSIVRLTAQERGARIVLYAGQPQGTPIVSHGPFIGDTVGDLKRSYQEYREGRFPRMSDIAAPARQQEVG